MCSIICSLNTLNVEVEEHTEALRLNIEVEVCCLLSLLVTLVICNPRSVLIIDTPSCWMGWSESSCKLIK